MRIFHLIGTYDIGNDNNQWDMKMINLFESIAISWVHNANQSYGNNKDSGLAKQELSFFKMAPPTETINRGHII